MLLEEIKPAVFKTTKKTQKLVDKYGIPSEKVLKSLKKGNKNVNKGNKR